MVMNLVNPNIAMGVQQPKPINVLGMAAEAAGLDAALREAEGARGTQAAIAGGMAPTDPRLLQFGQQGRQTYQTAVQGQAQELENNSKRINIIGSAAGYVRNNPTVENFTSTLRNLVQMGVLQPEEAQQALVESQGDPSRIRAIADQQFTQALAAKDQLMRTYSQDVGGAYQVVGVDPVSGETQTLSRTAKTVSPSAALTAETARNRLAFDAMKLQWEQNNPNHELRQDASGAVFGVNKRTLEAFPVTMGQEQTNELLNAPPEVQAEVAASAAQPFMGATPPQQFESTYSQVVGKGAAERHEGIVSSADAAVQNLPKIYDTLNQIESSEAITGMGADIFKNVERFKAQFMASEQAGERVADTEILDALLGSEVFPLIGALGIGARGIDTPAERDFLRGVFTGRIDMNRDTLLRLTEMRRDLAERSIERYNDAVQKGELDRYFQTQGVPPRTIEAPRFDRKADQAISASAQSDVPPPNIDPEARELWPVMTFEERQLWLK